MKFSIITASLNRTSLKQCCESVDMQTFTDYHHIVAFDGIPASPQVRRGDRRSLFSFRRTGQWGNYQRHAAWKYARSEYCLWLDDDNVLSHPNVLADIAERLEFAGNPAWAIFPIFRHGSIFCIDPPGMCVTDTANMVVKREFAQWPNVDIREADGLLAESLKTEHPYVVFPNCPPIVIMEKSSNGK